VSDSLTDLRPTEGARFLLERLSDAGPAATYRAVIYTPSSTYEAVATLSDDGTATIAAETPGIPDDLLATLTMLAKLTARSAAKKREDGLPPWPARILRWRGPGRGE
jgi:hypothetical protein